MHCTRQVLSDLIYVGADDRRLTCFEGVYGVPEGVSYNSYLLLDEKTVLFDTVDKAVAHTFFDNVRYALNGRNLDYLVIHHMEPDHAATIEDLIYRCPETQIICNSKIKTMLAQFFDYDMSGRIIEVKEGDTFSTGGLSGIVQGDEMGGRSAAFLCFQGIQGRIPSNRTQPGQELAPGLVVRVDLPESFLETARTYVLDRVLIEVLELGVEV